MATSKISRTFGWGLMGLVMVGLVGFGSTNFGGGGRSIGTVGDTDIDAQRYARELNNELRALQAQTGQQIPLAQAQAFGLDRQVLGRLLATTALENETARLGISVGDDQLRKRIVEISAFQGINGQFDREAYNFALEQSGLTAAQFEASLRAEVARQILQTAVASGTTASPLFVDTLYGVYYETRDFTWASLPMSALTEALPAASAEELTAFYDANASAYTLPETKNITFAWLNPEDLITGIEVNDEDLEALYQERIDEFMMPERRMVERLVFSSTADAQAAMDAITAGDKSFEDIVAERELTLSDVDLGDLSQDELGMAGDAIFAMTAPGVAGPVESDLGPAIFRMNAVLAAQETSFEQAREQLQGELASDAARRQVNDLIADLDDLLAGGATLEEIAGSHKMRLDTIDWTTENSDGIAAYESFREAALAAQEGDFPEITLMADGGVFALRVNKVDAPRLQTQDEVADQVLVGWGLQKRLELLAAQAESMIPALEGGESLSSLGLTEVVETDQGREAFINGAPARFINEVFTMKADEWRVLPGVEDVVLVRVDAVNAADQTSEEAVATKAQFAEQTGQELGIDIENAFARILEAQAGVTLDRAVINAIHAQFP
ncbi:SurA N-terminal domain-containing protein [Aliiroseovarius crassostreae]|uniref:SurA N-terminal domain-containing protein n=1 Tax=Aliiroseovarius crassostreae TaxID=154981 RepID=UPI00220DC20F|nr:SurA N-terminal domain-containing protein [Aliiroseovarius crassostreae]UWQ06206.1 SurA N-terminal domain-containing protein [Aliiroseovarius crassostreae]